MNTETWSIDQQTGIAKHASGLIIEIKNEEVVEIKDLPANITTAELPQLLDAAIKASRASSVHSKSRDPDKPRRPVLSLRK